MIECDGLWFARRGWTILASDDKDDLVETIERMDKEAVCLGQAADFDVWRSHDGREIVTPKADRLTDAQRGVLMRLIEELLAEAAS